MVIRLVRLFNVSLIRPHLEYAIPVWDPSLKKDIDNLENVQHRSKKLVPNLKKKRYEDRLRTLKLTTLEIGRKRGDLIKFYKALNGLECVVLENDLGQSRFGMIFWLS